LASESDIRCHQPTSLLIFMRSACRCVMQSLWQLFLRVFEPDQCQIYMYSSPVITRTWRISKCRQPTAYI